MWSFDSTQIADFVGIYIYYTLSRILNLNNVRTYRDDGLISVPYRNGPLTSKILKKVIRAFEYIRLKIEISFNLKIVNFFLDVTLNLSNNSYKPFSKSTTIPTYINVSSNHPASIVKQIPNVINIRINIIIF